MTAPTACFTIVSLNGDFNRSALSVPIGMPDFVPDNSAEDFRLAHRGG
jgi:hypothetical protein